MNIFRKIFGKKEDAPAPYLTNENIEKETESKDVEEAVKTIVESISFKVTSEQSTEATELNKPKHYKIPSVVKTAKTKLKKEGVQACVDYIQSILNDTNQLQKDQSISLTRNLVKILKTENHESLNNFDDLLNHCLSKYNVQSDPMFYSSIADIYVEYNPQLALDYLTSKNKELLNNETFQSLNYFLFLDKVKILIEQGDLKSAEEEIQKANKQIENNSMFQFLSDKIKFTELYSVIKLNEKDDLNYFKYNAMTFILDITKDLSSFPIGLSNFHYRKKICYSGEWGLNYEEMEDNFNPNKISEENFNEIKKEIYSFSFSRLPVIMGFDSQYIENEISTDGLKRDSPHDWYSKYYGITKTPFKYYEYIEKIVEEIIAKYKWA
ncbi:MAG: hypothetical protein ABI723_04415 [Bacteroidia bacterium]